MYKRISVITSAVLLALVMASPMVAFAADPSDSSLTQTNSCVTGSEDSCDVAPGESPCAQNITQCGTVQVIKSFISLFIAFAGLAVVISIVIGGIQYSMSAGDPSKAAAARRRIINAIIALVFFFFLFAMINFLVPGGPGVIR